MCLSSFFVLLLLSSSLPPASSLPPSITVGVARQPVTSWPGQLPSCGHPSPSSFLPLCPAPGVTVAPSGARVFLSFSSPHPLPPPPRLLILPPLSISSFLLASPFSPFLRRAEVCGAAAHPPAPHGCPSRSSCRFPQRRIVITSLAISPILSLPPPVHPFLAHPPYVPIALRDDATRFINFLTTLIDDNDFPARPGTSGLFSARLSPIPEPLPHHVDY